MGSLVRNTAVPATRWGGFFSSMATRASSGVSCRRVLSNSSLVPRRHVYMITITMLASASGTQPPSITFSRFAMRKVESTSTNGAINAKVAGSDQPHTLCTTMNAMMAVTTMVPVTAIP